MKNIAYIVIETDLIDSKCKNDNEAYLPEFHRPAISLKIKVFNS